MATSNVPHRIQGATGKAIDAKIQEKTAEVSKEERVGYHKGSINTLLAERNELLKIVQITEGLIQAHIQELEKLGVKLSSEEKK